MSLQASSRPPLAVAVGEWHQPVGRVDVLCETAAAGGGAVPEEVDTDGVLDVWFPAPRPAPHHASALHFLEQVNLGKVLKLYFL